MKIKSKDKFCKKSINLLYLIVYKAINFYTFIANTYKEKIYIYNYM